MKKASKVSITKSEQQIIGSETAELNGPIKYLHTSSLCPNEVHATTLEYRDLNVHLQNSTRENKNSAKKKLICHKDDFFYSLQKRHQRSIKDSMWSNKQITA